MKTLRALAFFVSLASLFGLGMLLSPVAHAFTGTVRIQCDFTAGAAGAPAPVVYYIATVGAWSNSEQVLSRTTVQNACIAAATSAVPGCTYTSTTAGAGSPGFVVPSNTSAFPIKGVATFSRTGAACGSAITNGTYIVSAYSKAQGTWLFTDEIDDMDPMHVQVAIAALFAFFLGFRTGMA